MPSNQKLRPTCTNWLLIITTGATSAPGVLHNDTKEPGATLLAVIGTRPTHGDLEFHSDGSFLYKPASGFTGTDTFTYQNLELLGTSAPPSGDPNQYISNFATVTIVVRPTAVRVFAFDDEYRVLVNATLAVDKPGVLGNDTTFPQPIPLSSNGNAANGDVAATVDPATGT